FFLLSWPTGGLHLEIAHGLVPAGLPVKVEAHPTAANDPDTEKALAAILKADSLDLSKLKMTLSSKPSLQFRFPEDGATPLTTSIQRGWAASVIRFLLEAGADPNFPDSEGVTPLALVTLYGCDENDEEIARALLEKSARVSDYLDFTKVYGSAYFTLPFEV